MRPIGGFFPFRSGTPGGSSSIFGYWTEESSGFWLLHNARSALNTLWTLTKPAKVWLPAYICTEVKSAVPESVPVGYYPLDAELLPSTEFIASTVASGEHVLAVDYFGRPPQREFRAYARSRRDVGWLQDCAQAIDGANQLWGDWLLYSPRKLLGVPDGGILVGVSRDLPVIPTSAISDLSFILPSMERGEDVEEAANDTWYRHYVRVESAMRVSRQKMSELAIGVLKRTGISEDKEVRRTNYKLLDARLSQLAFLSGSDLDFVPFGFPIRVPDAATFSAELAARKIFAARHWRDLPSDPRVFLREHSLANKLITLPCDYRYGAPEMRRVAEAVLDIADKLATE